MYLSEFFDSVKQIKSGWKPYAGWEKEQDDYEAKRKALAQKVPIPPQELNEAAHYGRTLIDIINTMDTYSINKSQDAELLVKGAIQIPVTLLSAVLPFVVAGAYIKSKHLKMSPEEIKKMLEASTGRIQSAEVKSMSKVFMSEAKSCVSQIMDTKAALPVIIGAGLAGGLLMLGGLIFGHSYSKYLTKQASRIARYQSREERLKDPRDFVVYDTDQINQAKEIVKEMDDYQRKQDPKHSIRGSVVSVQSLMKDQKNYENWKQEHIKAELERKNLDYSQITPEQLQDAKKYQQSILGSIKHIEISSQNYVNNVEVAMKIALVANGLFGLAIGSATKKVISLLKNARVITGNSKLVKLLGEHAEKLGAFGLIIAATPIMVDVSKEAAKIGRFKAKQELLKDPRNFVAYTDEQMDSVKGVNAEKPAQKGLVQRFTDQMKFLFQLKKDYKDYEDYNKTQRVEEEKLDIALKQVPLKEGQMKKAESLQKKVFTSFEKMDEKAQRYADDAEGATEMVDGILGHILDFAGIGGSTAMAILLKNKYKTGSLLGKLKYGSIIILPVAVAYTLSSLMQIYAIKIKQKAVRIGLMQAMDDLKDPKNFVDESLVNKKTFDHNPLFDMIQANNAG